MEEAVDGHQNGVRYFTHATLDAQDVVHDKGLTELQLNDCSSSDWMALLRAIVDLPKLHRVTFINCPQLTCQMLRILAESPSLHSLVLGTQTYYGRQCQPR